MNIACVNGAFITLEEAVIPMLDQGFLYGFGLFETVLVKDGYPGFLQRHFERMFASANILSISVFFSANEIAGMIEETINKNKVKNGSVRLTLSAGVDTEALPGCAKTGSRAGKSQSTQPALVIFTRQPLAYSPDHYRYGLSAGFVNIRRNEYSPLVRLKTLNYLENLLAKKEARARGWDEALFLNTAGNLAEGSVSNIFLVKENQIITPDVNQGLLPGIARQVVLEKCVSTWIPVQERVICPQEIWEADECFLTNSLMGVMPLVKVNGHPIGDGRPGKITKKLYQEIFK